MSRWRNTGQAGAIRHGVAVHLLNVDPDFRPALKKSRILNTGPTNERK